MRTKPVRPRLAAVPEEDASPRSTNEINALIHLYRAEVGRLTAYRARLDTTTSWAISSAALVATFAFGDPAIPHVAFVFLMAALYFLLQLEARRFRHYEASRQRVQLMEASFFPELLRGQMREDWIDALLRDLRTPGLPVSHRGAMGWRLRRSYMWIFVTVLIAWIVKLDVVGGTWFHPATLVAHARFGSVPGWAVVLGVGALYAWLAALAVMAKRRYPKGDDEQSETVSLPES